jgi:hypothetical protein
VVVDVEEPGEVLLMVPGAAAVVAGVDADTEVPEGGEYPNT